MTAIGFAVSLSNTPGILENPQTGIPHSRCLDPRRLLSLTSSHGVFFSVRWSVSYLFEAFQGRGRFCIGNYTFILPKEDGK